MCVGGRPFIENEFELDLIEWLEGDPPTRTSEQRPSNESGKRVLLVRHTSNRTGPKRVVGGRPSNENWKQFLLVRYTLNRTGLKRVVGGRPSNENIE